jgi:Asp-tRNA(Asn)/Glu-tRNA(Gln) amidotransferase A subunit family amidase
MTTRPHTLFAWQAATALARRELDAEALARDCLARVAERDGSVHAFAHLDAARVLAEARAIDAGPRRGPLHGLPVGVKDLIDTAEQPTTYGSAIYAGHRPRADAAVVVACRAAGALAFGKTVSTEFAYFHPGPTTNPHDAGHTPGGSSSGSAAAVADAMLPLALGTQTAGSIIRPAAYCGVVGWKPSHGRVSRAGVKSLAESLDTVGGFGRCVRDVALLGAVLTADPRLQAVADGGMPLVPRLAVCRTPEWGLADADTQRAFALAEARLAPHAAAYAELPWPHGLPDLVALQKSVMAFEMARALGHEHAAHRAALSERLVAMLDEGRAIDGARHAADRAAATAAAQRFEALFGGTSGIGGSGHGFDAILAPSATGEAPAGLAATGDPVFCRGWTLLGLPCIHLPFTTGSHGLPIGLQLVGRQGDDHRLLAAAEWVHGRLTA